MPETITKDSFLLTVVVDGYNITINSDGNVYEQAILGEKVTDSNKTYTKNGTAIIPVGFAIVPGLDDISQGLVISDVANDTENAGNQFVWIPVTSESEYERNTTYANTNVSTTAYDDVDYLPEGITDEKQAVLKAGGFYIGRYEAGKEGTDTLVSKKGATVWTSIPQTDAKAKAKTFINNSNIKSALITGIQWDVAMGFISKEERKDGTGEKTYNVTTSSADRHKSSVGVEISGNNEADRVCNIYDLEGNAREYIAEKNTYSTDSPCVNRGGSYVGSGSASYRSSNNGGAHSNITFRFTLYVK